MMTAAHNIAAVVAAAPARHTSRLRRHRLLAFNDSLLGFRIKVFALLIRQGSHAYRRTIYLLLLPPTTG